MKIVNFNFIGQSNLTTFAKSRKRAKDTDGRSDKGKKRKY